MKMRLWVKILVTVVVAVVVIIGGAVVYLNRGLEEMQALVIGEVDLNIPDGIYQGTFEGYRWSNTVAVTVEDQRILSVDVVEEHSFHRQQLVDELSNRIIEQQTPQVDVVSGATVSSKAFLKAVENALQDGTD